MIILDTCALVFDALAPEKLGKKALEQMNKGERDGTLACCDITLWEIAMLIQKGRLKPGTDTVTFLEAALTARNVEVLPITPEIANISSSHPSFTHCDPADRLIAATTIHHKGRLVTCDSRLSEVSGLKVVW